MPFFCALHIGYPWILSKHFLLDLNLPFSTQRLLSIMLMCYQCCMNWPLSPAPILGNSFTTAGSRNTFRESPSFQATSTGGSPFPHQNKKGSCSVLSRIATRAGSGGCSSGNLTGNIYRGVHCGVRGHTARLGVRGLLSFRSEAQTFHFTAS